MDLSQFKIKFIEEAHGLISQLEECLLDQEDNLDNKENVQLIFRVLHTLKGTSAMYGFVHIGDLVHDLESIFDLIREDKQEFTTDIFESTLKIVDHLRNLLNDETLEEKANQEMQKRLLADIDKVVSIVKNTPQKPLVQNSSEQENPQGKETYYIIFYPNESQIFRCINILQIFHDLAELGEYKIINHGFQEHNIEGEGLTAWGIYLVTDIGIDAIEDVLMFVLDDCKILKVSNKNLFDHDEFVTYLDTVKKSEEEGQAISIQKKIEDTIATLNSKEEKMPEVEALPEINEDIKKPMSSIEDQPQIEKKSTGIESNFKDVGKQVTSRINIDAEKLDQLMYLVSELVITKSQLNLIVQTQDFSRLNTVAEKIDDLSRNFRDNALNIRLVPVAEMMIPFKRMIRDLSKDLGKEVKFVTKGIDTELDKNVIDRLTEPIMHILRNCIDHGIETPKVRTRNGKSEHGTINFTSFYSGANVYIQIQDDGAGINPKKIRLKAIEKGLISAGDKPKEKEIYELLFNAGFSTAEKVTEVSGRGVGMDVVKKKINEVRGEVELNSELGVGTTITIKLHQTLSIIDTLLVKVDNTHYLVPIADIDFCDQEKHELLYKNDNRQVEIDNELIPYISLRDIFDHSNNYPKKEKLIVINKNDKRIAIIADKIVGEHQAVLKPLGEVFQAQQFLSGASFLGDGSLALMLDTTQLANKDLVKMVSA